MTEFKITGIKRTEIKKEDFLKLLASKELTLTIDRVGKVQQSKYPNKKTGKYPDGCFIDYTFKDNGIDYKIGIWYNLGQPTPDNEYKITDGYNIFKIFEVVADLSRASEVTINSQLISESLTGISFTATTGTSKNGGFIIKPLKLIC